MNSISKVAIKKLNDRLLTQNIIMQTLIDVILENGMITEKELEEAGVNIVIYANQLFRSAYPSMLKTAKSILKHGRTFEAEDDCMSIKEILKLIDH